MLAHNWFETGSGLVQGWFRVGSGLVQGWLVGSRLVSEWFLVAFLPAHSNYACFGSLFAADSLLLCCFALVSRTVGCWFTAGSELARGWLKFGSGSVPGWSHLADGQENSVDARERNSNARGATSFCVLLGHNGHYAALRMFCSVPLYSDLLAEAVQLHAALVRERQVRLSFKWRGRPSAGGKLVLKVLRGKALQAGFGANGKNPLCFCPVLRGSQRTQRAQTGAESLRQTLNGPAGRETEKQSGTNARETKTHRTQTHAQT